jgi:hypothetical protein
VAAYFDDKVISLLAARIVLTWSDNKASEGNKFSKHSEYDGYNVWAAEYRKIPASMAQEMGSLVKLGFD